MILFVRIIVATYFVQKLHSMIIVSVVLKIVHA